MEKLDLDKQQERALFPSALTVDLVLRLGFPRFRTKSDLHWMLATSTANYCNAACGVASDQFMMRGSSRQGITRPIEHPSMTKATIKWNCKCGGVACKTQATRTGEHAATHPACRTGPLLPHAAPEPSTHKRILLEGRHVLQQIFRIIR